MTERNRQQGAQLRAVEQRIRQLLSDTNQVAPDAPGKLCGVTPFGRPPTWAGSFWYGIYGGRISGTSEQPQYVERRYGFAVVITCRVDAKPQDRLGNALLLAINTGLYDRVDQLADELHGDYELLTQANTLMRSEQVADVDVQQGFSEPAIFRNASEPQQQGAMWFGADPEKNPAAGVSSTLMFDGLLYWREKT